MKRLILAVSGLAILVAGPAYAQETPSQVDCSGEFVSFYSRSGSFMSHIGFQTVRRSLIERLSSSTEGVKLHTAVGTFTLADDAYDGMYTCLQLSGE